MDTRYGAYGVIVQDFKLLLTQKKSGPYKGLWGLPGGAIEFGESPEEALRRELIEETALVAGELELFMVTSASVGLDFHQIGIIYKVVKTTSMPNLVPEEKMQWVELTYDQGITPFARHVISTLKRSPCGA